VGSALDGGASVRSSARDPPRPRFRGTTMHRHTRVTSAAGERAANLLRAAATDWHNLHTLGG